MNKERIGKYLQQVEHIRGHLVHIYSIKVNQVMVATVNLSMFLWISNKYGKSKLHKCHYFVESAKMLHEISFLIINK